MRYFAGRKEQRACKPGSVASPGEPGPLMAIHLDQRLPSGSRALPPQPPENRRCPGEAGTLCVTWACSGWGLPCRFHCWSRGALLPHPFTLTTGTEAPGAVCFLWHCPWARARRGLPGTLFPWSPDFPHQPRGVSATIRPSAGASPRPSAGRCKGLSAGRKLH